MRFASFLITTLTTVVLLGDGVVAAVLPRKPGDNRYIVILKEKTTHNAHMAWLNGQAQGNSNSMLQVTGDYNTLNGYTAELTPDKFAQLSASPDVAMVVKDQRNKGDLTQTDAPWGIARISRQTRLPAGSSPTSINYVFNRKSSPAGVDVYILDTGVNTAHVDFGGRARWGATFGGYRNADGHGHGTHIAGTIAGRRFGVAKAASIIAVKVLGDDNAGWNSDLIAGIDWAVKQAQASRRPSVLSISIGSGVDPALDAVVGRAVSLGLHVVVSAGNSNKDVMNFSPARAPSVITVGATNINDQRWVTSPTSGSNFGAGVDLFAPGQDIMSTYIGSTTAIGRMTGTSMATPHVSGLIAYLLAVEGRRTPANMLARIKQLAPDGVLGAIPAGTRNEIIWNGGA